MLRLWMRGHDPYGTQRTLASDLRPTMSAEPPAATALARASASLAAVLALCARFFLARRCLRSSLQRRKEGIRFKYVQSVMYQCVGLLCMRRKSLCHLQPAIPQRQAACSRSNLAAQQEQRLQSMRNKRPPKPPTLLSWHTTFAACMRTV